MTEAYKPAPENDDDADDDSSESGASKKKKKSLALGELTAEKTVETSTLKDAGKAESLWERLTESKEADEKDVDTESVEIEVPLDKLSQEESQEVVQQYTEARLDNVAQEAAIAPDVTSQAEVAANAVLLENIQEEIRANPDAPVEEAIENAEASTVSEIDSAGDTTEAMDHDVAPEVQSEQEDDEAVPPASTGAGAGTGVGAGSGGVGGGGRVPPAPPQHGGAAAPPPYGGGNFNAIPPVSMPSNTYNTTPQSVTPERAFMDERLALAQGLVVGGIVGYLIGKRRGRIKTERRLLPIQKKLEKQVTALHSTVAEREKSVRKLAGEKAAAVRETDRQRRFAEYLQTQAANMQARREQLSTAIPQAAEVGRVLVEGPMAAVAGTALQSETRPATNINKKVEAYSTDELKQAAEKVKVDNTTLKELYDSGRLDEKAVRRVMTEFIEGRSVRAAISSELLQKEELRFERDPKMRHAANGQVSGGGAAASPVAAMAGALLVQQTGDEATTKEKPAAKEQTQTQKDTKKPSASNTQEIAQTAFASFIIIVIFTILILLAL